MQKTTDGFRFPRKASVAMPHKRYIGNVKIFLSLLIEYSMTLNKSRCRSAVNDHCAKAMMTSNDSLKL